MVGLITIYDPNDNFKIRGLSAMETFPLFEYDSCMMNQKRNYTSSTMA